jgi:hypothetical protein
LTFAAAAAAQELPPSGVSGLDLVYATGPGGNSQLYGISLSSLGAPMPIGGLVGAVPSRWAHRRRTLSALETAITFAPPLTVMTPMGDAVGNGAIHFVDARVNPIVASLVPTGNPAAYDLALDESLQFVFSCEDDGSGGTKLRGFSYATPGQLVPLNPSSITLVGSPAAYVNRIGVDAAAHSLHVPTVNGVHVVNISAAAPQMSAVAFYSQHTFSPTTNPTSFLRSGVRTWVMGTARFSAGGAAPVESGFMTWTDSLFVSSGSFGIVPATPSKLWVPAVGAEELAVVGDGLTAYIYSLLREPEPGTFFVKPAGVGVVKFLGSAAPAISTILCPAKSGEPFGIPAVFGARVAFESSFGQPFWSTPPGGGEVINIIYTPLDFLGSLTPDGLLGVPAPLGGRISTKGMDRPIWSRDGKRVFASTSYFTANPSVGMPGIEVLDVPTNVAVTEFTSPHTVVANTTFPNQTIVFPTSFEPRVPQLASALAGFSFYGSVFHDGLASIMAAPFGEIGQKQIQSPVFVQSTDIPNFRSVLPAKFNDAVASTVNIPNHFGARRTAFNLYPDASIFGLTMSAAMHDKVYVQPSGYNFYGILGFLPPLAPFQVPLPAGWITTSEFTSL